MWFNQSGRDRHSRQWSGHTYKERQDDHQLSDHRAQGHGTLAVITEDTRRMVTCIVLHTHVYIYMYPVRHKFIYLYLYIYNIYIINILLKRPVINIHILMYTIVIQ